MLPESISQNRNIAVSSADSFASLLKNGYHFEIKTPRRNAGIRYLFYDKKENTLLISHSYNNRVHLLNLKNGKLRWFDHHYTTVRSVQTNGNNSEIITSSWDGTCMAIGFEDLEKRLVLTEKEMGRSPYIAVSNDADYVYSYSYDSDKRPALTSNVVRKWDLKSGKLEQKFILPGKHLASRRCGSVEVDSTRMFVVSDTGYLQIYDLRNSQLIAEEFFDDLLQSVCILPAFNALAVAGDNGDIYICDYNGKLITKVKGHKYYVSQLMLHPCKPDTLISVSHDSTLKVWGMSKLKNFFRPKLELLETVQMNYYNSLWTATMCNNLAIAGGDSGDIEMCDIKNQKAELKGKLVILEDSYAYISADKKAFYASDLSLVKVCKNDGTPVDSQFADYLIKTTCNFKIFRDLFSDNQHDLLSLMNQSKGFFQLSK